MIFPLPFNIPPYAFFPKVHFLQKRRFQEMKLLVWIQLPKPLPVRTWQKCFSKKSLMTFFNPTKMGIPFSHTKTQFSPRTVCQCYIFDCSKYYSPVIINQILRLSGKIASNRFQTTKTPSTSSTNLILFHYWYFAGFPFLSLCCFTREYTVKSNLFNICKDTID